MDNLLKLLLNKLSKQELIDIILSLQSNTTDIPAQLSSVPETKKPKSKPRVKKKDPIPLIQEELSFEEDEEDDQEESETRETDNKQSKSKKSGVIKYGQYGNANAANNFKQMRFTKKELEEINKDVDKIKVKPRSPSDNRESPLIEIACINPDCGKKAKVNIEYYDPESYKCNDCCRKEGS